MTHPGHEPGLHTSSISLTDLAPAGETALGPEALAAIRALPAGTALLVAHGGPDAVSRRHVELRAVEGGHHLVDLGSLNGTYVNGDRVDDVRLRSGMELRIGRYRLSYHAAAQA